MYVSVISYFKSSLFIIIHLVGHFPFSVGGGTPLLPKDRQMAVFISFLWSISYSTVLTVALQTGFLKHLEDVATVQLMVKLMFGNLNTLQQKI